MGKIIQFKPQKPKKRRRYLSGAELLAARQAEKPHPPRNGVEYLNELQRRASKAKEDNGND